MKENGRRRFKGPTWLLAVILWPVILAALVLVLLVLLFYWLRWMLGFRRKRRAGVAASEMLSVAKPGTDARRVWRKMKALAQPTLLLAPTADVAFSRMGGAPDLPPGAEWPSGFDGPRAFLAQLDLVAVRNAGGPHWLPDAGALYFFDDTLSDDPKLVVVIYADQPGSELTAPPAALGAKRRRPERRVQFLSFPSLPSLDWLGQDLQALDVDDHELDALSDAPDEPFGDELQHRIGGYPSEIQEEQMSIAAELASRGLQRDHSRPLPRGVRKASGDWRLLFQADTDPSLKMSFGDAGRLYVFIREADARTAEFSKTVTIWQTH
jgi:uncharacterized protein YwqG